MTSGSDAPESVEPADAVARVEDVSLSFGDVTVLDGLSLALPGNGITALVGPNGSGKTTLARVLVGDAHPESGARTLRGDGERRVGYLPQTPRFRPGHTVEETLRFYATFLSSHADLDALMERVGLQSVDGRRVGALSGGMHRLLGLAVSLLGDPPLVVLDEPTSGLDPRMHRHVVGVVADVADAGTGVLVTTHDLSWAARTDRVVVLDRGRVVREGPPAELLEESGADSLADAFLAAVGDDPTVRAESGGDP